MYVLGICTISELSAALKRFGWWYKDRITVQIRLRI